MKLSVWSTLSLLWLGPFVATLSFARADDTAAPLEKILALPSVSGKLFSPVEGFSAYGGSWSVDADGTLSLAAEAGPRLDYDAPQWRHATDGVVELELRFPTAASGFSGICIKVSDSAIGADDFNGYEIGFNPAERVVNLGAHRYNYVQLRRIPYEIPIGRFFTLRVEFDETGFVFDIDGQRIGEYREEEPQPNAPLRAGTFTMRGWENPIEYRNLRVRLGTDENVPFSEIPFVAAKIDRDLEPETLDVGDLPPFIYIARSLLNRPNSVGNDLWQSTPKRRGCAIRYVDPSDPDRGIKTLFEDPDGSIYDMNLSFDAQTIFFSYRSKDWPYWNIWKIGIDGEGLAQLTHGPFFDVSPCELPDGGVIFVSTRRFGRAVCQPGPASNLFRMNADGTEIQCVSMNTLSDFNPQVLSDGRVLFTRWEYVDRDLTYRQSLWTENPDGTNYQLFYGNTIRDFGSILQARQIPDAPPSKVMATFTPHHGYPHGAIGVVDRSRGIEAGRDEGFTFWTKEFPTIRDTSWDYAWRDPFPLDEERALCAFGSNDRTILGPNSSGSSLRYRIWLLDCDGNRKLLCEEPELDCFCPIAVEETPRPQVQTSRVSDPNLRKTLRPRLKAQELFSGLRQTDGEEPHEEYDRLVERVNANPEDADVWGIPERMDLLQGDPVAQVVLADVYQGLEPFVERGVVKKLRIMEQIRKTEELYDRSFDQSPSMGVATYYAKRCWGEVPVEPDGSANFYVPALREIYFQALDEEDREIQRMTSAAQFMPGESVGCIGCHEDRDTIPATAQDSSRRPTAGLRAPDMPVIPDYIYDAYEYRRSHDGNQTLDAGVVDYNSLVQPVLDQYCVSCHDGADPAGGYDLSGDLTRFFTASYDAILLQSRSYRQADMLTGQMPEDQRQLGKPLAQFYWLLFTTSAVNEPYTTGALASRLPEYFTEEHCEATVDDQSLKKINFWLDSNAIYHGTYAHTRPQSAGRRDRWAPLDGGGLATWFNDEFKPIYDQKCAECHQNILGGNHDLPGVHDAPNIDWTGRFAWLNLSRPEKSAALNAHLPKEEGGRGLSTAPYADRPQYVFESKDDPDWKKMLAAIAQGRDDALAQPEADQPGFQRARPEP
jgi:hypothetical protein